VGQSAASFEQQCFEEHTGSITYGMIDVGMASRVPETACV
jgi:hypothetical protein